MHRRTIEGVAGRLPANDTRGVSALVPQKHVLSRQSRLPVSLSRCLLAIGGEEDGGDEHDEGGDDEGGRGGHAFLSSGESMVMV
jgi:hypothetical protein